MQTRLVPEPLPPPAAQWPNCGFKLVVFWPELSSMSEDLLSPSTGGGVTGEHVHRKAGGLLSCKTSVSGNNAAAAVIVDIKEVTNILLHQKWWNPNILFGPRWRLVCSCRLKRWAAALTPVIHCIAREQKLLALMVHTTSHLFRWSPNPSTLRPGYKKLLCCCVHKHPTCSRDAKVSLQTCVV